MGPRRPGDPPRLVAASARIRRDLGWAPTRDRLDAIIDSAWRWMRGR
jgi:UDP-glucose 4-epimerase